MKKFIITLFVSYGLLGYSQNATFKATGGVNIVSSSDPYLVLNNTDYDNVSSTNVGGKWIFIGTNQQTISGTQTSFYKGTFNNPNGFIVSTPVTFSDELNMITGIVSNTSTIEIGTGISNVGVLNWTDGTITGQLKRWFDGTTNSTQSSGIFPIGTSSYNRNIIINYTESTLGGYLVGEYVVGLPSMSNIYNGLPLMSSDAQLVTDYVPDGYWSITPDSYSSTINTKKYSTTIRANTLTNIIDRNLTRIIKNVGPSNSVWSAGGTHNSINGVTDLDYTLVSDDVIGFNWLQVGIVNNTALPIELLSFTGKQVDRVNVLNWVTASEINNDYFLIEKSLDGVYWGKLGVVVGSGNSTSKRYYSLTDYNPIEGVNYYRLTQVDYDGVYKVHNIISIDFNTKSKLVTLYPNPTSDLVTINSNTSFNLVKIMSVNGVCVGSFNINNTKSHAFSVGDLDNGFYSIMVYSDNILKTLPIKFEIIR